MKLIKVFYSLFLIYLFNSQAVQCSLLSKIKEIVDDVEETVSDVVPGLWVYDENGTLIELNIEIPDIIDLGTDVEGKVFFTLHTQSAPEGEVLYINDTDVLNASNFNASRDTIFVTHGWLASNTSAVCTNITSAYLNNSDYNVIVVDWSSFTKSLYGYGFSNVKGVGKYIASMIEFLEEQGMNLNDTKLVGHSLGAHVMGLAGYYSTNTVNYVVGLDPAYPLYYTSTPEDRLSTESARFVEVIHTNAGLLGYLTPIGHADFYVNKGTHQRGCGNLITWPTCSHSRSYYYYAESINSETGFYGLKCSNQMKILLDQCEGAEEMMGGVRKELNFTGSYYVPTNKASPYAMGT